MDQFEKVEKLMSRANVTYAEAKDALETANWDLLDAMIVLEQRGKTVAPETASFSTSYKEQAGYNYNQTEETTKRVNSTKKPFWEKVKALLKKSDENHLIVEHKGEKIIELPIWLTIIILLVTWSFVWILIVVSLFLDCRYSFRGPANMNTANNAMDAVESAADSIKSSFRSANSNSDNNNNNY